MQGATAGTRACAYCKRERVWTFSGRKLKDGSKIYLDELEQRWSGRRCPACERARVQAAVRCDDFDKDIIARGLEEQGYTVPSKHLPLIVEKDGKKHKVAIRRAYAEGGRIVLETPVDAGVDLVALVFESVRVVPREQLDRLGGKLGVHGQADALESESDPRRKAESLT